MLHKIVFQPVRTMLISKPYSTIRVSRIPKIAPLSFTSTAVKELSHIVSNRPDAIGVLFSTTKKGCNGKSYSMNLLTQSDLNRYDMHEQDNILFAVEPKSLMSLIGTTVDYKVTELSSEFTFVNPQEKGRCGCGESFNT